MINIEAERKKLGIAEKLYRLKYLEREIEKFNGPLMGGFIKIEVHNPTNCFSSMIGSITIPKRSCNSEVIEFLGKLIEEERKNVQEEEKEICKET